MRRRDFFKAVTGAAVGATIASKASATPTGIRISVDKEDPAYDPGWHTADVEIFCDGKLTPNVITADSKEGYVKFWRVDRRKDVRYYDKVYGKVEIKVNGRIFNG